MNEHLETRVFSGPIPFHSGCSIFIGHSFHLLASLLLCHILVASSHATSPSIVSIDTSQFFRRVIFHTFDLLRSSQQSSVDRCADIIILSFLLPRENIACGHVAFFSYTHIHVSPSLTKFHPSKDRERKNSTAQASRTRESSFSGPLLRLLLVNLIH